MRPQSLVAIALICALTSPITLAEIADALPSWNEGTAKKSILDFVRRVTSAGGRDFVPVSERIATFDNDGCLWAE